MVSRCWVIHPTWNRCFLNTFKKRLTTAISTRIDNNNVVALHYFINMNYQLTGGNDSNLLIVFYVQIMPDDFVMQLHRF
ncbi:hypothetical protein CIG24_23725 [Escherichia coli]|nr:hypothetical protein CIG24_23725 [Escherichia coli]OZS05522.1 hypothetical protein CIG45_24225 [Escherichia coli]